MCLHIAFICTFSYASAAENPIIIDDIILTDELCELENGTLTIIINGTYTDLIYSIDNGATFQESNFFGNLGSGDYIAIVADASSCSETFSIQIVDAPLPQVTIDFVCEPEKNRVNVSLTPFVDGIQPFTYNWDGPNGARFNSRNLDEVEPGTYFVTVTDRIGCSIDTTLSIPVCCELIVECSAPDTTNLNCISEVPEINSLFLDNNTANDINELTNIGINVNEKCSDITVAVTDEFDMSQECGTDPLLYKRIYRIDDGSNLSTCEKVIIIDNYGDILLQNNPQDLQVSCDENIDDILSNWIDNMAGATFNSCSDTYDVETVPDVLTIAYSCIGTGALEVEFIITDECDNELTFTSTVNVADTMAPDVTCPNTIEISADEPDFQQQVDTWLEQYDSSDNCSSATVINDYNFNNLTFDCDAESLDVEFTATDDCGNTNDCVTTILITDIFIPEITCPETLTIQCGGANNDFLITEWLGMSSAIGYNSNPLGVDNDLDQTSIDNLTCNAPVDVRFFATSACLQDVECITSVQVIDIISPELDCPPSLSLVNGDDNYENTINEWLAEATASDNCGQANLVNDFDISAVDFCDNNGDLTVEFIAEDDCDNTSICESLILLTPYSLSLECPNDIIIDCSAPLEAEINFWLLSASAIENGMNVIQVDNDFVIENLNTACDGITEVSFNALSTCVGSDENCTSTIRIIDTTAPDIICPQNIIIELGTDDITSNVSTFLESITASDDCHVIDYRNDWDSGSVNVACSEDIEVLFTATDDCDNVSDCISMISFINNVSPEINCPEEFSIYCDDRLLDNKILEHLGRVEVESTVDYDLSNDLDLELLDRDCEQDYFVDVDISVIDQCDNDNSCTASIHIYPPPNVYIPNVFSPGSNNTNEIFTVFSNSSVVEVVSMIVFDRWGSPVFEQENFPPNDTSYGWDGFNGGDKEQSNVMTYYIVVTGILGDELEFTGSVQVMK
ncbi:gliding motility-associated C-terminal domain-containing protein [Saprospiraceae bacterium]|nr:gliding motility-associated C-terminal domain-containing protein [Saprospiraceae bacterium]